jgi:hypothetical protein
MEWGTVAFAVLKIGDSVRRIAGVICQCQSGTATLGCTGELVEGIESAVFLDPVGAEAESLAAAGTDLGTIGFVKVPVKSLVSQKPKGWEKIQVPPPGVAMATFLSSLPELRESDSELVTAEEDDTEQLRTEVKELKRALAKAHARPEVQQTAGPIGAPRMNRSPPPNRDGKMGPRGAFFQGMEQLYQGPPLGGDFAEEDELDDDGADLMDAEDFAPPPTAAKNRPQRDDLGLPWDPPGGGDVPRERPPKVGTDKEMLKKTMLQMIASGKDTSQLMPLLMLQMLDKPAAGTGLSSQNSEELDDEDDDFQLARDMEYRGLKAIRGVQALGKKIKADPMSIIRAFEKSVRNELGTVNGQAWTLKHWIDSQNWGRFQSIRRGALQDAAVYEFLRRGQTKPALAQVAQNLKSKLQAVMDDGDWTQAWHLTGLPTVGKKEFAGTEDELSIIVGYEKQMMEIRKRQGEFKAALSSTGASHSQAKKEE